MSSFLSPRIALRPRFRWRACCIAAVAASLLGAASRAADWPYSATVKRDYVHIRSGPGPEYYATESLPQNEQVEVLGRNPDGWCYLRPPVGSYSWVAAEDLDIRGDGTAMVLHDDTPVAVGSRVRDRSRHGAGSQSDPRQDAVQVLLQRGQVVQLFPSRGAMRGDRVKIVPPADEYRWVHEEELTPVGSGVRLASYETSGATTVVGQQRAPGLLPAATASGVSLAQFVAPTPAPMAPMTAPMMPSIAVDPNGNPCMVPPPDCGTFIPVLPARLPRHYFSADALGWWVKGDSLPALVTTSPIPTPQAQAGVLGEPGTSVLYGNGKVNDSIRPGARLMGGIWVDPHQTWAVEGHYYALPTVTSSFSRTSIFSDGSLDEEILARPYVNALTVLQTSWIVAFPDYLVLGVPVDVDGSIQVKETSFLQSAGGGLRYSLGAFTGPNRVFLLGAYRYFNLKESLKITATSALGSDPFPIPVTGEIEFVDQFETNNTFNGGEIGIGTELVRSRWSLGAETRLAMGNMHQTLDIDGSTAAISGPFVAAYPGGLLAQPSNMGDYSVNKFALIPSVDVKLGYMVLPALRLTVGYNFTWVSSVLRPGENVDTTVNLTQIAGQPLVGPARPQALLADSSLWLQGITAGLDLRF